MQEKSENFTRIIERLKYYIDNQGYNFNQLAKKIGVSNSYFSKMYSSKGSLGEDIIGKILLFYENINPEWLLLGKGEMLKSDISQSVAPKLQPATSDLVTQLIRENGDLRQQLGEQINENKHLQIDTDELLYLRRENERLESGVVILEAQNYGLEEENETLKAEIERLKNAGNVPKEYDFYKPELMMVAEKQAEYSKSNK